MLIEDSVRRSSMRALFDVNVLSRSWAQRNEDAAAQAARNWLAQTPRQGRMIISLASEAVDQWLMPAGRSDADLQTILDTRQRPYSEHRAAA